MKSGKYEQYSQLQDCGGVSAEPRPRAEGGPPPCNVATVAMDAKVNNSIAGTQPYMFEPSEPDTDCESDNENAQPRASQSHNVTYTL